jgi:tRNA (guanine37-N1)-methyltransferase
VRADVVTIFPEYLAPLDLSLIGRARRAGLIDVVVHDLRDFTHDRHRTVDDAPMGGGAGMVMRPEPWGEALEHVLAAGRAALGEDTAPVLVVPSPAGEPFRQATARELAGVPWIVVACGRYEGIDERVLDDAARTMPVRPISLGDYVLNGGEVAALVVVEAVGRLLPGVLGNAESLEEESHEDGLLEYPVYTRPATWRGLDVPPVLLSGHHGQVRRWRRDEQLRRTAARRPDLVAALDPAGLDRSDLTVLAELGWQPGDDGRLTRRLVPDGPAVAD